MKTNFIVLLFCFALSNLSNVCFAQNERDTVTVATEEEDSGTTEEVSGTSSVIYEGSAYNFMFSWKKNRCYDPHWTGLGMAFIGFSGLEGADLKSSTSYSFILNPAECYLPIYRNWLAVTGFGIDWSRYHFKGDIGLADNGFFPPANPDVHYRSSKLLAYYVTVPLLIEYQKKIGKNKEFYISGGAVGYFKCYSKSQVEYADTKQQVNLGKDLNILPVNIRFMAEAGIEDLSIFAYYSPVSLIEKGKGPELRPMGIGLKLNF